MAKTLAQSLWHEGAEHSAAIRSTFTSSDPTAQWERITLPVGGQSAAFRTMAAPPWWVAVGILDEIVLGLEARNVEPSAVRLVVIDDFEPYLRERPP